MIVAIFGSLQNTAVGDATALSSGLDIYNLEVARLDVGTLDVVRLEGVLCA
jgi:hypothetical protein